MAVLELQKGIEYLVDTSDRSPNAKPFHFVFCHKDAMGNFVNGLTTEDILEMLIKRGLHMLLKDDCIENVQAHTFLRQAQLAYKRRSDKKNLRKIQNNNGGNSGHGVPVQTGSEKV